MSNEKIKPILHYDFEHFTEDGKVQDMSGNGYHGTINGATRCEDMWGQPNSAMSFDGVDDYIGADYELINGNFTIAMNVYPICGRYGNFVSFGNFVGVDSGFGVMYRDRNNSGDAIHVTNGHVSIDKLVELTNQFIVNQWNTILLSIDSDNLQLIECVNGELYTHTLPEEVLVSSGYPMYLARSHYTPIVTDGLEAIYETFKFYEDSLTPTQVKYISAQMMRKTGRQ
jgi:hypothetical protein